MGKWISTARGIKSFTLVEMIASVTIIVVVATMLAVYVGNVVKDSKTTSDRQTLVVLNDALTRFKCGGGDINALTSGAPIKNVLAKLQQPMNWAGLNHQFLQNAQTYLGRSLDSKGENQQYHFTRYNSYMAETGGTSPGNDPVTYVSGDAFIGPGGSLTFSQSVNCPAGANGCLIVGVCSYTYGHSISSVTFDDVAMTLVDLDHQYDGGGNTAMFVLTAPHTGSHTLAVNFSGNAPDRVAVADAFFTGVNQSSPIASQIKTLSSDDHCTDTVSSAAKQLCVDVLGKYNGTATANAGQTKVQSAEGAFNATDIYISTKPGATSVTMGWTFVSQSNVHIIAALQP